MKLRFHAEDESDIDLTPMIDVVFLLVIFFMVTTTFIEEAKVYKIQLPVGKSPQTISRDKTVTLSLTSQGQIFLRGKKEEELKDLALVVSNIKEVMREADASSVILRCDAHIEYERYLQAKNALRLAGVDMIFEEVEVVK